MGRRLAPEINAGSMADIAFLLLVFFIVTAEMSKEEGILQILPEKNENSLITEPVKERNAIRIFMNENNDILFEDQVGLKMSALPKLLKEQILNTSGNPDMPENRLITRGELQVIIDKNKARLENAGEGKAKSIAKQLKKSQLRLKALEIFGNDFKKSNHVISITPDKGVKYGSYIKLKDKIAQSYRELRSELAKRKLGRTWKDLTLEEKRMLEMVYKKNVSESPIEQK
jgi:biopolymer transport protein ExbD